MDTIEKLNLLSEDSQYDLACACGTVRDEHRRRGSDGRWLYPLPLPQGGHSFLLKTLLSNACVNDCRYCPLRSGTNVRRCTLSPEEVAKIFMEYLRKKKIFGLFLSSGVIHDPDHTMDRITAVARILRHRYAYRGYIHLKVIPGASDAAVEDALSLASAVSLNVETPDRSRFKPLSRKKDYDYDILRPLKLISKLTGKGMRYGRVKCTTQFIVGASDETDAEIIQSTSALYHGLGLHRVYFSAYQKGLGHPDIPGEKRFLSNPRESFMREHRLYQVDFLLRKYGFNSGEIPLDSSGNLRLDKDPKELWAESHREFYPVRINTADKETLLKVPGLGPDTVRQILKVRREQRITGPEHLGVKGTRLARIRKYVLFE
jgi:predicted DNA-binding helix-hairpin-helix protein